MSLALTGLMGCASASIGMHGHHPELLWNAPVTAQLGPPEQASYAGPPVVLKRFESRASVPVGAHFIGPPPGEAAKSDAAKAKQDQLPDDSMAQAYVPVNDLAIPMFEAAYNRMQEAGFPIWKDYWPSPTTLRGPHGEEPFVVVLGEVQELELHTFAADALYEAVRVVISFRTLGSAESGADLWTTEVIAKSRRTDRDVLEIAGQLIADAIAGRLQRLPSVAPATKATSGVQRLRTQKARGS